MRLSFYTTLNRVLKLLFERDGLTVSQIAGPLGPVKAMAEHHRGALHQREMITFPMIMTMGVENPYDLTQKGREYFVKKGLV